jgi:hypothetical protein
MDTVSKLESDAHKIAKPIVNSSLLATIFRKFPLHSLTNPLPVDLPCTHQNHIFAAGATGWISAFVMAAHKQGLETSVAPKILDGNSQIWLLRLPSDYQYERKYKSSSGFDCGSLCAYGDYFLVSHHDESG